MNTTTPIQINIETQNAEASRLRNKSLLSGLAIGSISLVALPIIAILGILATLGVFTFTPDALLIPSLGILGTGFIALITKLICYGVDATKENVIAPLNQ